MIKTESVAPKLRTAEREIKKYTSRNLVQTQAKQLYSPTRPKHAQKSLDDLL